MENGIAMLSFVPRDDKQSVYDNSAYEAERINHTQLENSEFPPPPPYWQNDNDDVYPRVDEEMRTAVWKYLQSTLFIPKLYTTIINRYNDYLTDVKLPLKRWQLIIMHTYYIKCFKRHMFWIFVRIASLGPYVSDSNKYQKKKYILWENKNKREPFLHILSVKEIFYNSKFILMATSLGTNALVVTRVMCIIDLTCLTYFDNKITLL